MQPRANERRWHRQQLQSARGVHEQIERLRWSLVRDQILTFKPHFSRGAGKSVSLGESGRIGEAKYGGDAGPASGRVCHVRSKNKRATSNRKLAVSSWSRSSRCSSQATARPRGCSSAGDFGTSVFDPSLLGSCPPRQS